LKKFKRTGELTHLATHNPRYGDFDTDLDYLEASTRVLSAQADFAELSAEIRAKMENDPAKLLAFMADPENIEEMRELGLVLPETAPEPSAMADPPATGGAASEGGETPPPPPPSSSEGV
jgi:phage internal scaffolding protein